MARALSNDLRSRVLKASSDGLSARQAAARFGAGISSAIRWIARAKIGELTPRPQGGLSIGVVTGLFSIRRVEVWLACALGHKACREDFSVAYHRLPRLFATLALARGDGRYPKVLKALARTDLLILDDWGPEKLNDEQRRDLLEIIEDRYEKRSTIVTSQVPVDHWYDMIGNPTLADAILDRLVHNAYRIELSGESLRKQRQTPADA